MIIEKTGGRRAVAEPKNHSNCLELMPVMVIWFESFLQ